MILHLARGLASASGLSHRQTIQRGEWLLLHSKPHASRHNPPRSLELPLGLCIYAACSVLLLTGKSISTVSAWRPMPTIRSWVPVWTLSALGRCSSTPRRLIRSTVGRVILVYTTVVSTMQRSCNSTLNRGSCTSRWCGSGPGGAQRQRPQPAVLRLAPARPRLHFPRLAPAFPRLHFPRLAQA